LIRTIYHTSTEPQNIIQRFLKPTPEPKTAVLVHGLSSGSRTWDEAVIFLLEEGYNVLTLDLSGHGDSSREEAYSFGLWVENVLDAMKQHKIDKIDLLMGHSLGGLISVGVSSKVEVKDLILIDPLISQPSPIARKLIERNMLAKHQRSLKARLRRYPKRISHVLLNDVYHTHKWDVNTLNGFDREEGLRILQSFTDLEEKPRVLLVKPRKSILINNKELERFTEWNMKVVELDNVGHGVHIDDFAEFQNTVKNFI
jgi:pimeloyl-ACP methyl ester carboxylesterase